MNVAFATLGCKVNQYETQAIRELFLKYGYTANDTRPDIIVINSCTVTAESDRKTRQLLNRLRKESPNAIIVLTGCMVEAFIDKSAELDADIIIGNTDISLIPNAVEQFIKSRQKSVIHTPHPDGEKYNTPPISSFNERTRAYMKIEDGCNRFCSYCIIPTARGRVRSRGLKDILSEAERLAENGYKEIVLTGINLSAYGFESDINICDAVDTVCSVNGIKRVRLGSLEPDHITDEMLYRLASQEKFCPQFHLSLQSGCDETLKRMNRHYDSAFYYDLISRIRKNFDDASITTDVMVGFAGETEKEFSKSLEFVKKCHFARTHIFMYSKREGTVAAALKSQVTNSQKQQRAKIMSDAAAFSENEFLNGQIGKVQSVLFEAPDKNFIAGYTPNYSKVFVETRENLTGEIKDVLITDVIDGNCIGKLI